MNPTELKELARTFVGIADGKPWQIRHETNESWRDPASSNPLHYAGSETWKIRLKPWELTDTVNGHTLPPGAEWHRQDWTEDMLPAPFRPLMLDEQGLDGMEFLDVDGMWKKSVVGQKAAASHFHRRTTSPIPFMLTPEQIADGWVLWNGGECPVEPESRPTVMFRSGISVDAIASLRDWERDGSSSDIIAYKPDPYGKFRQALADGGVIQCISSPGHWIDIQNPAFDAPPDHYRVKPEPQWLPLGPEDVPPGSVLRFMKEPWYQGIAGTCGEGIFRAHMDQIRLIEWDRLFREDFEINRPRHRDADGNPTLWEPCCKQSNS